MPILLYCIAKSGIHSESSMLGVGGLAVTREEFGNLAAFTSRNSERAVWLQQPVGTSAVEFHRVLKEIFKSAAIIPFRFPTIFETQDELIQHLQQQGAVYEALLEKFANTVQMELRITHAEMRQASESGTDYLKNRRDSVSSAEQAAEAIRQSANLRTEDWRQRGLKDGVRAFALVERGAVTEFENLMRGAALPKGFNVRVSGPWPVTEFLEIG